jgi:GTP-binding protein
VQKQLKQAKLDQLVSIQCFSALKYAGLDELKAKLQSWLAPVPEQGSEKSASQ